MKIKVKYHDPLMPKLKIMRKGDWIDLYVTKLIIDGKEQKLVEWEIDGEKQKGWFIGGREYVKFELGVSIELPQGYEAWLVARSSTFGRYGLQQTNPPAIIDNSYCGDEDIWHFLTYATRGTFVPLYARLCQFRIIKNMEKIEFIGVEKLFNENRGGIGQTGI